MMKDDRFYVRHVLECIGRIAKYTSGGARSTFLSNTLIQDGVIRNLQVLAESTMRISERTHTRKNAPHLQAQQSFRRRTSQSR